MSTAILPTLITEEEYLTNPEYEHCEYIDGRAVPLNLGTKKHSKSQVKLSRYLDEYLDANPIGYAAAELHCLIMRRGQRRYRLPDVAIVLNDVEPESRYLDRAPDLVIEIRSPEDTMAFCYRKMEEYFGTGAKLGWLVLPEKHSVIVLTPEGGKRELGIGEMLDGGDVLPGFELLIDKLF